MKSLIAFLATILVVAHAYGEDTPLIVDRTTDPFHDNSKETYGGLNLIPSMKIRLAQGVSEMFRDNLANYGRAYLNSDFKLKEKGGWGINWVPLVFRFTYDHLQHAPIQIDMKNFTLNYTSMTSDNTPVIYMQLPLVKDWSYSMDYKM